MLQFASDDPIDLCSRLGNGDGVRGNRLESHGKVVLPLKDHPRSATLNGGIPNINCHFGGLTFAYSESWIVSFVRWLAPLTNARCRLRSGRTKLGTVRVAFCALARQGHPRGGTSIGRDFPRHRRLKIYHSGVDGVSAICSGCTRRTNRFRWRGLFSGRRPSVRLKGDVPERRQARLIKRRAKLCPRP